MTVHDSLKKAIKAEMARLSKSHPFRITCYGVNKLLEEKVIPRRYFSHLKAIYDVEILKSYHNRKNGRKNYTLCFSSQEQLTDWYTDNQHVVGKPIHRKSLPWPAE